MKYLSLSRHPGDAMTGKEAKKMDWSWFWDGMDKLGRVSMTAYNTRYLIDERHFALISFVSPHTATATATTGTEPQPHYYNRVDGLNNGDRALNGISGLRHIVRQILLHTTHDWMDRGNRRHDGVAGRRLGWG